MIILGKKKKKENENELPWFQSSGCIEQYVELTGIKKNNN